MRVLRLATTNPHKVDEIRALLGGACVRLRTLADAPPLAEPEETAGTFEGNARLKGLYYAARLPDLVVAEDSGLEIDALGGDPGVRSARFLRPDATYPERFDEILRRLRGVEGRARSARFVCAMVAVRGADVLFETRGVVEGEIAAAPSGSGGFGYDPIFFVPALGRTLAEAGSAKAAVSHRGQAVRALVRWLADLQ
ncbi:MAG: non-canonical purine NTP pyrophosphatase [Vicinamibacterales bacterium]